MSFPFTRRSRPFRTVLVLVSVCLAGGALWWAGEARRERKSDPARSSSMQEKRTIYATSGVSHRVLGSLAADGTLRPVPALPSLEDALGLDSKLAYAWRLEVVHSLKPGLSSAQIERLVAFIQEPRLPQGLSVAEVRALKNDVLNVLGVQREFEPAFAALLTRWSQDQAQDPILRNYALQQLSGLAAIKVDASTHWQAVAGDDPGMAATAMLHLMALNRDQPFPINDRQRLAGLALKMAADPSQPDTYRSTALQICGQLKASEARLVAYEVARSTKLGFPLRIAAVATLGDLGGGPDVQAYLQQLAEGPEQRLRVPAESALKRFSLN